MSNRKINALSGPAIELYEGEEDSNIISYPFTIDFLDNPNYT